MRPLIFVLAAALATSAVAQAPAPAAAATPAQVVGATKFIDELAGQTFGVLRDKSMGKPAMKAKFRAMLQQNVALDDIGPRLIRRHRAQATPAQLQAYQAVLPDFIINTYTDRLVDYTNATVKTVRATPRGARGDVDVFTRVTPAGGQAFDAVWQVKTTGGRYKLANLTVSGVNVALTQEADFSNYIQKNGFDGLIAFMKAQNARAA